METKEIRASHRYARISDQKAREVTRAITGMPASHALNVLNFTPKKAAVLIGKVLRSAIANAAVLHEIDADDLYVKSALAIKGPILHRIMPRARGSAAPIRKRMAHIIVIVATKPEGFGEKKKNVKKGESADAVVADAPKKSRRRAKKQ
ncbi:MAG: 50S ribosomal protein L22 [Verrucomicrobia bacterium]|nr:50S ribosomal protein L22 [Verrucomicrobiota bacterium]